MYYYIYTILVYTTYIYTCIHTHIYYYYETSHDLETSWWGASYRTLKPCILQVCRKLGLVLHTYVWRHLTSWGLTETRRYLRHEPLYKSCEWREKNWHHSSFIVLDFSFFSLGSVLASETPQTLYSHSIFLSPRNSCRLTHPQEHMCTTPIHKLP